MPNTHQTLAGMRRNLSRLASGAILSQALMVGSTPLLTRIYAPDAFGVMAVFSSVYAIAIPLATLKYDASLILPKSDRSAIGTTRLTALIASLLTGMAGTVAAIGDALAWFSLPGGPLWLPLALWLGAMYTLTQQWSARRNNYRDYARSQVVGAILNLGTSLALGMTLGGRPEHLIAGFTVGMAGSVLAMCWHRRGRYLALLPARPMTLLRRARVYRQFPLLVLPTSLIVTAGQSSIPLILSAFYPINDVGQFAVANRVLLVPAALIGGALTEAFRAEFVRRQRDRLEASALFTSTLRMLALIALPLFGVIALTAPYLFSLVFGAAYEASGHVALALVLGVATQFIGNPFASIFIALRRTALGLRVQILTTAMPLAVLLIGSAAQLPLNTALGMYAGATAVSIGLMLVVVHRLCQASQSELITRGTT
jgi:O-antigen/teichoic acid export membrane protein